MSLLTVLKYSLLCSLLVALDCKCPKVIWLNFLNLVLHTTLGYLYSKTKREFILIVNFGNKILIRSTWVAHLVEAPTLDFGWCHDLRVVKSDPTSDLVLGMEPA